MSKVKMFTLLTGAIGETFKSGTREPSGDYVGAADYTALRDALREALDGWEDWLATINNPMSSEVVPPEDLEAEKRISELRKLLES